MWLRLFMILRGYCSERGVKRMILFFGSGAEKSDPAPDKIPADHWSENGK